MTFFPKNFKLLSMARKCDIKHWLSCGTVDGGRSAVNGRVITKTFLGWIDFLSYGAPLTMLLGR